ncbi:ferrochelatase [Alkalilimnicola ehrlichii]|uniref:Ferrochelatase n=1 Tax=Alkalilimnicola ehrlichii TaxID=351052 RepID=A0A3E0WTB2_9GAMM|nr:ferrochelatase [Alkalilimnicola ehrlichii]RFA27218.1 ferrochelatase [Alkalilimnicola ehrlichii]RFA35391.1 ferrochelatase [Alkalilimnicola ehrlichii]
MDTEPHGSRIGVLLTNLGTPDEPTPAALKRYLREFLGDPRIVEAPRALWWLVLNGIILRTRPRRSAQAYRRVWTEEGSPLLAISRRQASALQKALRERFEQPIPVALGMRYGNPSLEQALAELEAAGVERLLVLPLYPQYSATTTASTFDAVSKLLRKRRNLPELRFVRDYHDDARYIEAMAHSIREFREQRGTADKLVLSFHGIPRKYVDLGDPYRDQCARTAELIAAKLGLHEQEWVMTFQSRFGPKEWLKPYTDKTLKKMARSGTRKVDLVCPGFAVDCLETLEENAMENRDLFLDAGGENFRYIPCLNDRPEHIAALASLVGRQIQSWL